MIVKMQKYTFLVFHKEYQSFLDALQQLGAVHIVEKTEPAGDAINQLLDQIKQLDKTIQFLSKREAGQGIGNMDGDALEIVNEITQKRSELATLEQELEEEKKRYQKIKFWGDFSTETINKLKAEDLHLKFLITSKKKFDKNILSEYHAELINESANHVYWVIVRQGNEELDIDAEESEQPEYSSAEAKSRISKLDTQIQSLNNELDHCAKTSISLLKKEKADCIAKLDFEKAILNTDNQAEEKVKILEAWVPETTKKRVDHFLDEKDVLHTIEDASDEHHIPILIKNNRFAKLFEPIGNLFSLPAYHELDLTLFFAPFFMLFFGFCLGDAGYGLLFIAGAGLYKRKAKKEMKPMLSLVQYLGLATVIFGAISGTFFGINLIEAEFELLANYRKFFLNPDKMFNLALILGAFQIIFALFIKAANQIKQYGFAHSLATFGWLIVILGSLVYYGLTTLNYIGENNALHYSILSVGAFFILFFSDVKVSIPARVGKGIWDIYSTITGIFGDILSYIRLFALGLSSAILGFVINDIGLQILYSSKILGPVFFVIFLILGHTLNILIASLGSFVHPMRLTFVEFYKNAGFKGGGKEYKPFSK